MRAEMTNSQFEKNVARILDHPNYDGLSFRGNENDDGGGGGSMNFTLPDLRWNVALLNAAAVVFLSALVGGFLWMVDRIDDRFDQLNEPLRSVQIDSSRHSAQLDSIQQSLIRIEEGVRDVQSENRARERKSR